MRNIVRGVGVGVAAAGRSIAATSSHALDTNSPGPPICVTGMGRCGTSLTTALIGLLGVDLGPTERMLPTNPDDNARGYWEQQEIYEINEEILRAFGGAWERPPDFPPGWERSPALTAVRDRARHSLIDLFGSGEEERWAWKDPRASVTLPFWRDLIGGMDYVLCVRNPADVAASLAKRDIKGLEFDDSVALWLHYVRASLENTQGHRRLILCYEDYFIDTDRQIRRLAEFVCGPGTQLSDEIHDRVESFIEPELWHNRDSVEETNHTRAISPEAADLFARLSIHTATGQPAPGRDTHHRSLLAGWSVSRVWWLALILSSLIAATDAMLSHVILIPLLVAGPFCALLTGRWARTAIVGIWTVALAIILGLPDEIWGTHMQLIYIGFVATASLLSTSAATIIEKGRYHIR
ncbi:MAG TPA: sulfotransferase [Solirubrobacteraceae bacterium]|nr:sulfotransferase [Solirubrobacteraceae bacterium]